MFAIFAKNILNYINMRFYDKNHPDKTPRTISPWRNPLPRWTTPPPRGQNPVGQNPRTNPPGQPPPLDKHPRIKPPQTKPPPGQNTPGKTPYKTSRTLTTTAKPPRINPGSPTMHPEDKNLAKPKMAFILNSDGFRALLLMI